MTVQTARQGDNWVSIPCSSEEENLWLGKNGDGSIMFGAYTNGFDTFRERLWFAIAVLLGHPYTIEGIIEAKDVSLIKDLLN